MNKAELSDKIAERVGLAKKQVESVLDAFESITTDTLKTGGEVTLTGFGTFLARRREARAGVNPQNPTERIQIPAVTVPKFKSGKNLKEALKHQAI
jgi:DNA-binding protein HU-beta